MFVSLHQQTQTDMKPQQTLENQISKLWASYDLHTKNARNTSSISRMNLYIQMATKAKTKAFELQNELNDLN